jgi:hypothetical protein
MSSLFVSTLLLGVLAAPAAPPSAADKAPEPKPLVYKGTIKDVRGIYGVLKLSLEGGAKPAERTFWISLARIVGPDGDEWKIGDLRKGDRVEVVMAADGKRVQEVRVVKAKPRL